MCASGQTGVNFSKAASIAAEIVRHLLRNGMPRGVQLLNVNFPSQVDSKTPIRLTTIESRKYKDKVLVRKDPRWRPYDWLWGDRLGTCRPNADAHAVHTDRTTLISP